MIEIKTAAKLLVKPQAVNKVTMDIGEREVLTDRSNGAGKSTAPYHGRIIRQDERRGADG